MEIKIYTPKEGEHLQSIDWNYSELKEWLTAGLQRYKGVVYTPEMIPTAKADRADLNRLAKAINDKRIAMKKDYLKPFEEFEAQCKELTAMINEQSGEIDEQVKAFEDAEKEQKQSEIIGIYNEVFGDLKDLIPYESVHDKKWLNKGTSIAKVREALEATVEKVNTAFKVIDELNLDEAKMNRVKGAYLRRFDLSDAMAEKERIEEEDRRLAEYEAKKAEEKRIAEESLKKISEGLEAKNEAYRAEMATEGINTQPEAEKPSEPQINAPEGESERVYQLDFRVWATKEQMNALKAFLIDNGIKYGRVQ